MFLPQELIRRKRDGLPLSQSAIEFLVSGMTNGRLSDSQIAALAMAIYFQDLSAEECLALTCAMRDSGQQLDWSGYTLDGPLVDKHSTGGVGDLISLTLGPIVAACGGYIPMVSGRGLGHTGGTIDKLESITGYNAFPSLNQFQRTVADVGIAIVGADQNIAPADKRLYAIRDITSTVDSLPLICSSILSKKLTEGLDTLVMDIKVGNGALMATPELSAQLAQRLVEVSTQIGCHGRALLTDMNQPLAHSCGNALEVIEAMDFLDGNYQANTRVYTLTCALAQAMLVDSHLANDGAQAQVMIEQALSSGEAAERFNRMVFQLGGPRDLMSQGHNAFASAPIIAPLNADRSGYLTAIDTLEVGYSVIALGGGRVQTHQPVDHRVGLSRWRRIGDKIRPQEPLVMIHAADQTSWQQAARRLRNAITIGEEFVAPQPVVYQHVCADEE